MPWQPAGIVHPDAELLCTSRIRPLLAARGHADVFVGNRIPTTRRERMVIWTRDGGAADGLFDNPRMRCRVWDVDDQKANELAHLVAALMPFLVDGAPVLFTRKDSGPFDVPDATGAAQKYLLFTLRTRGETLP